jgi:hypothetical protein
MAELKHGVLTRGAGAQPPVRGRYGAARLAGWLRRVLGRECAEGFWMLSPDGKLVCDSVCSDACRTD